jgi:hypothetical protein
MRRAKSEGNKRSEWERRSERVNWGERIVRSKWRLWIQLILRHGVDERLEALMGTSNSHFDSFAIVVRNLGKALALRLSLLHLGC